MGDNLGRYTLLKRLAVGGMGEVYVAAKAGPVGFGPYVALKVLREELAVDRTFVEMLVDEANISMFLNHQNVVSVLDLSEDAGRYYIAMEYVQGVTVERLVESLAQKQQMLPIPAALYIATELCRALKYAHTRVNHAGEALNIVHRDVTPANILLSTQGEVKLTDFGIARARGRVHQTQAGVLKGKFGYMAPEMVRYEKIDARADLFCVGVVVYLMLSGQHPVAGAAVMEAIQRFEDKQVVPPSQHNPQIPPALDTIVMRALEPKPDLRWASAAALGDALQDVVLQNPAWRKEAKDGAKLIAGLMRGATAEAFTEPVPRDQLAELLKRAKRPESMVDFASESSTASAAQARTNGSTAPDDRASSGTITAREKLADARRPASSGSADALVELETHDVLPAISPDQNWGPTPAITRDMETDEEMSLSKVRAAMERDTDTDENDPMGLDTEEPTGIDGKVPDGATLSFGAIKPTKTEEQSVDVKFPESSTDRNRVHDDMMAEPSLPGLSAGEIDGAVTHDKADDGETVVGVSLDEIGPEDSDDALVGAPTMAMEPVTAAADDGKTVAGMEMPDWDAMAPGDTAGPVVYDPALTSSDEEDAATIIPTSGGPVAPLDEDVAGLLDFSDWDGQNSATGDATLLDDVSVSDVQAAMAAQRQSRDVGATLIRDESQIVDPANAGSTAAMDALHDDTIGAAPSPPAGPQPFSGPIRIAVNEDDVGDPAGAAAALARSAGGPISGGSPIGDEAPTVGPPEPKPPEPKSSGGNDVGAATGAWMAGELNADALEWDDDAAARRAVATRNSGNSPSRGSPAPHFAPPPSPVAQPSRSPAPAPAPISQPPGPISQPHPAPYTPSQPGYPQPPMPQPPPASFFARNWLVMTTVMLAVALFAGLGYAWMFTELFWPKLKLDSTPPGAIVAIDDVERGTTPLEVKVEPSKRHLIEFELDGHKRALREITEGIGRGRTYTLTVTLERVNPRLNLPAEGAAYVNGRAAGKGRRIELTDLPESGEVKIRVVADGYEPYEMTFGSATEIPPAVDVPLTKK